SLKNRIAELHYQSGLSPWLWPLLPFSGLYGMALRVRQLAYALGALKRTIPPAPVISVGNLTTGGTGKTPIVVELAKGLAASGKTVVVLSRGYGAAEPVPYARALDPRHGDEAYLIQSQVPEAIVVVGVNRVYTLQQALQDYHPDLVLLDDGFQYLPLHRHLNILLIDGERLLGNGRLLPAGPLREPLSALARADLVLVTKQVDTEAMQAVNDWVEQYGGNPKPTVLPVPFQPQGVRLMLAEQGELSLESLNSRAVVAFSGIANPERFEQDLQAAGVRLIRHVRFPDHHVYSPQDVNRLIALLEKHQGEQPLLITTEKDLVKVASLIPTAWRPFTGTLQVRPMLDGQWFYSEFITPMLGESLTGAAHAR
ncbi:MAG TPA: tetraacyldisaccharide 4'-kinase, partial [Oculatellaceae cyanobacterium]